MQKQYKYAGVNNGCYLASNVINSKADSLEDKMAHLHQISIDKKLNMSMSFGACFSDRQLNVDWRNNVDTDEYILNTFVYNDLIHYDYRGHLSKINGVWVCTNYFYSKIQDLYFHNYKPVTKRRSELSDLAMLLSNKVGVDYNSYSTILNALCVIKSIQIGSAKNVFTKLVNQGYVEKAKGFKAYKVINQTNAFINHSVETIEPIANPTKTYRPKNSTLLDSLVALKGTYNNIYSDYIDAFDARIELLDEADAFIKEYVADDRIEGKKFYSIDDWVDKRVVAQGWTSDEVMYLIYTFIDAGYVTVDYDAWTIMFNKDCKKTIN